MRICDQELDPVALWEHALGLPGADGHEISAHLAKCAACRQALAALTEGASAIAMALPPLTPSSSLRTQLLEATEPSRFEPLLDKLADFFDLTPMGARRLAGRLDDDGFWKPGGLPGLRVATIRGGARKAGAYTGLLRLAAGARFPHHLHVGGEDSLVLAGGFRGDDGRAIHPGDTLHMPAGSRHTFVAIDGEDCIAGVVVWGGLEFGPG